MTDEKIYIAGLGVLFLLEGFFSVPLAIDSIVTTNMAYLVYLTGIGHGVWLLYGSLFSLKRRKPYIHWMGMGAFIGSFIPVIGFIPHLVTAVRILKELVMEFKK